MHNKTDAKIIKKYIRKCAALHLTLKEMAERVGRTKGWASLLVNGKIATLKYSTRNSIVEFLEKRKS